MEASIGSFDFKNGDGPSRILPILGRPEIDRRDGILVISRWVNLGIDGPIGPYEFDPRAFNTGQRIIECHIRGIERGDQDGIITGSGFGIRHVEIFVLRYDTKRGAQASLHCARQIKNRFVADTTVVDAVDYSTR